MAQPIRFNTSYQGYDPKTIFAVDEQNKQLRPISSGEAFTGAGYQFGQEQVADPAAYSGYSIGSVISRADQLATLRDQLNNYQQQTFQEQSQPTATRQSSALQDNIAKTNADYEAELANYKTLVEKYNGLQVPNLSEQYTQLREQQGIPTMEQQLLDTRAERRALPYAERAATGNAGVTTESQLGATVEQKDIPLGIEEQNMIDRLKLANDFVTTALNLKEKDANAARDAISNAINLAGNTLQLISGRLSTLRSEQQQAQQQSADTLDSILKLTKGQTFDQLDPATKTFITNAAANSGLTLDMIKNAMAQNAQADTQKLVTGLITDYPDAGILPTDSYAVAQQKLQGSKIYQNKVRLLNQGGGSGSSDVYTSTKPVSQSIQTKYNLPATVTEGNFNRVKDAIQAAVNQVTGGKGVGSLTVEQRYSLWGQAADDLQAAGYDPTDFNALLWETFHPEGLAGYKKYVLGQPDKNTSSSTSIKNPFVK